MTSTPNKYFRTVFGFPKMRLAKIGHVNEIQTRRVGAQLNGLLQSSERTCIGIGVKNPA